MGSSDEKTRKPFIVGHSIVGGPDVLLSNADEIARTLPVDDRRFLREEIAARWKASTPNMRAVFLLNGAYRRWASPPTIAHCASASAKSARAAEQDRLHDLDRARRQQ